MIKYFKINSIRFAIALYSVMKNRNLKQNPAEFRYASGKLCPHMKHQQITTFMAPLKISCLLWNNMRTNKKTKQKHNMYTHTLISGNLQIRSFYHGVTCMTSNHSAQKRFHETVHRQDGRNFAFRDMHAYRQPP